MRATRKAVTPLSVLIDGYRLRLLGQTSSPAATRVRMSACRGVGFLQVLARLHALIH